MKINYFVVYPNNTYEFIEKDIDSSFLKDIEYNVIKDISRFDPCKDYPGYFIANNECQVKFDTPNRLASKFINEDAYDTCAIVKSFEYWPSENEDFDTFNDEDRNQFKIMLDEYIKVINNENN